MIQLIINLCGWPPRTPSLSPSLSPSFSVGLSFSPTHKWCTQARKFSRWPSPLPPSGRLEECLFGHRWLMVMWLPGDEPWSPKVDVLLLRRKRFVSTLVPLKPPEPLSVARSAAVIPPLDLRLPDPSFLCASSPDKLRNCTSWSCFLCSLSV